MEIINILEQKGGFFNVLSKTGNTQIATMTIEPGGDSGTENIHPGDQVVYVIAGDATIEINGEEFTVPAGHLVQVPINASHRIYNRGQAALFFLNVYAPPAY